MRWIVIVVLSGALYAALIGAHERWDSRIGGREIPPRHLDASGVYQRLMREGLDSVDGIPDSLFGVGFDKEARELAPILPHPQESWLTQMRDLADNPTVGPYKTPQKPLVLEPRGVMMARRPPVHILRLHPGMMRVRLEPVGGGGVSLQVDVPVGKRSQFPEGQKLLPGMEYRVLVEDAKLQGGVLAEGRLRTLTVEEEQDYRRQLLLLSKHVSDVPTRFYAQASLAMSGALYSEAADILLHRFPSDGMSGPLRGLQLRRAFLHHHFRNWKRRDLILGEFR